MKSTAILNALGELVFVLDRDQRVTAAYGSGLQTRRYKAAQFMGRSIAEAWPADVAALHVHMNGRALDGQVVVYDWEFPFPGSGQPHDDRAVSAVWRDRRGERRPSRLA
jgi:PAS domain-containing protein